MLKEMIESFSTVNYVLVLLLFIILGYRPPWWNRKFSQFTVREVRDIPGPLSLPILGTRWVFSFGGYSLNKIHNFYRDMHNKYGMIMKEETLFNIPVISIFDKKDIEKVFKSNGKYPIRPPNEAIAQYRKTRPDRYATAGLVNEQGEIWYHLRSTLTTELTSPSTISSFLPQVQEIADDWCNFIKLQRDSGNLISNLEECVTKLGLETSCALVLGRRMGFLLSNEESSIARRLANAIHNHFLAIRNTYYGLPLWRYFMTPTYRTLSESEEEIYDLALKLIETADDATKESKVFQGVLRAPIDEREKTAALVDFLAAGIHTLRNSLVFLLYYIAKYPDTQQKILEDPSKAYLKACMMEVFRLLPTAFCLARVTHEPLELSGYKVNAGSVLLCHTGIACREECNFQRANDFRPERWLNEEKQKTVSNSSYLVTPFGMGKRLCPGKRFIEHVLPVILENTVKNFDISTVKELELQFEFLLASKGPTPMIFKDKY